MTALQLRPYQQQAITDLREALRRRMKRPVLQLPTGGGKTLIASEIIRMARERGSRVIFTAPKIELIDQTVRKLWEHGITDVGVLQAMHPQTDPSRPVQVASLQTLARREIPPAQLVIVDECHQVHKSLVKWMETLDWAGVPFIGLSATPWARGMGRIWDHLIVASTVSKMIEDGWLCRFRVFAPSHPDLGAVKIVAGDYHEGQLSAAMQRGTLTADIVETWKAKADGRATLVFAVDRAHARQIGESFEAAGIRCGYVDGETPRLERDEIRKAFERGQYQVVVNIGVLTTGVDWNIQCIVLARPTRSEILYLQMIGRGLRLKPANDPQDCLILDHSDTTLKLGFVTDIHHDKLNDGRLADANVEQLVPPKPVECKACHAVMPPRATHCPECGAERPKRSSGVVQGDGELVEFSSRWTGKTAEARNRQESWPAKVAWIRQLRALAIETKKGDGWVAHKYKDRYGVWPNHPEVKYALPAANCGLEVRAWVKAMNIRWAKSQEKLRK